MHSFNVSILETPAHMERLACRSLGRANLETELTNQRVVYFDECFAHVARFA